MQALAPIAVGTADFDVALVGDGVQAAWTPGQVRVANESAFALQCMLGADVHWLQPWSVDVWPVRAVTSMHVHPVPLVTPVPTPQWSTLLVTVAQAFEEFPGQYPATLDRQSASFYNRQRLFPDGVAVPANPATPSFTVASGGISTQNFTLPAGTVALRLLVTAGGLLFSYQLLLQGLNTVEQYYGDPGAPGSPFPVPTPTLPLTIPIELDWDQRVSIEIFHPTQNVSVFVSALFAPEPPGQAGASQAVQVTSGNIEFDVPGWQAFSHVTGAGTASCASPPSGTRRALLHKAVFSVAAFAGRVFNGRAWDGASGGTQIGNVILGYSTGGTALPAVSATLERLVTSPGNVLTLDFDFAAAANEQQSITASGDLRTS